MMKDLEYLLFWTVFQKATTSMVSDLGFVERTKIETLESEKISKTVEISSVLKNAYGI